MSKYALNTEREALIKEVLSDISVNLIVPDKIINPDPIVVELRNHFKSKDNGISYSRDGFLSTKPSYFNTSITLKNLNRALLIIDTFVNAIKSRNHQLLIEGAKTYVKIKDEKVEIRFWEKSRIEKKNSEYGDTKELIPTDLLFIQLIDIWVIKEWGDTPNKLLEDKLARVIGGIEFYAKKEAEENIRRNILKKKKDEDERLRIEIKQKKDNEHKRFSELLNESKRWTEANHLRIYLNYIESNCPYTEDLSTWLEWARAKADWYDPLIKKEGKLMDGFNFEN